MLLSINNIIPPKEWYHDPKLCDNHGNTVAVYLLLNNISLPNEWKYEYDYIIKYGYNKERYTTTAIRLASKGIIPPKEWEHDATIKNTYGSTVAHSLARKCIVPPKEWYHDPSITNNLNCTVAHYLANNGIIPPKEWYHDPNL